MDVAAGSGGGFGSPIDVIVTLVGLVSVAGAIAAVFRANLATKTIELLESTIGGFEAQVHQLKDRVRDVEKGEESCKARLAESERKNEILQQLIPDKDALQALANQHERIIASLERVDQLMGFHENTPSKSNLRRKNAEHHE